MNRAVATGKLRTWIQEELASQERLHALLDEQEAAVRAGDLDALVRGGEAVERELAAGGPRARRRDASIAGLAAAFGVAPSALTLSSVVERLRRDGGDDAGLDRLRDELRRSTADVLKRGRRVGALVRAQHRLCAEVRSVLLGLGEVRAEDVEGRLVDARG